MPRTKKTPVPRTASGRFAPRSKPKASATPRVVAPSPARRPSPPRRAARATAQVRRVLQDLMRSSGSDAVRVAAARALLGAAGSDKLRSVTAANTIPEGAALSTDDALREAATLLQEIAAAKSRRLLERAVKTEGGDDKEEKRNRPCEPPKGVKQSRATSPVPWIASLRSQ